MGGLSKLAIIAKSMTFVTIRDIARIFEQTYNDFMFWNRQRGSA